MKPKKIDWVKIEHEYVTGSDGQKAIAARFGVTSREVAIHSSKDGWVEKRRQYRKDVSVKLRQKAQDKYIAMIDKGMDVLGKDIDILDKLSDSPEVLLSTQTPGREMESKISAMIKALEAIRKHIGMIDPDKEAKLKLEREKLEFEKKKAETEQDTDREIKVVLGGELEQWAE